MKADKVLIAVDDERFGKELGQFVSEHNWGKDTQFVVLNVIAESDLSNVPAAYWQDVVEEAREKSRILVSKIANKIRRGLESGTVTEKVMEGRAKETIIEFAGEWNADLIIMGSHGSSGFRPFMLGGVSAGVVTHAPCSVIIIRAVPTAEEKMPEIGVEKSRLV